MKTIEFLATFEFGTGDDIASHHETSVQDKMTGPYSGFFL